VRHSLRRSRKPERHLLPLDGTNSRRSRVHGRCEWSPRSGNQRSRDPAMQQRYHFSPFAAGRAVALGWQSPLVCATSGAVRVAKGNFPTSQVSANPTAETGPQDRRVRQDAASASDRVVFRTPSGFFACGVGRPFIIRKDVSPVFRDRSSPSRFLAWQTALRPTERSVGLCASVLAAIAFAGCSSSSATETETAASAPPVPVVVAKIVQKTVPITGEYIARTVAVATVDVKARVSGMLAGVAFEPGQVVKRGQLLFTISPDEYDASLQPRAPCLRKQEPISIRRSATRRRTSSALNSRKSKPTSKARFAGWRVIGRWQRSAPLPKSISTMRSPPSKSPARKSSRPKSWCATP
jgi:hypothetical protein